MFNQPIQSNVPEKTQIILNLLRRTYLADKSIVIERHIDQIIELISTLQKNVQIDLSDLAPIDRNLPITDLVILLKDYFFRIASFCEQKGLIKTLGAQVGQIGLSIATIQGNPQYEKIERISSLESIFIKAMEGEGSQYRLDEHESLLVWEALCYVQSVDPKRREEIGLKYYRHQGFIERESKTESLEDKQGMEIYFFAEEFGLAFAYGDIEANTFSSFPEEAVLQYVSSF